MDQIDKKNLGVITVKCKISMKDLAEVVHLSSPSVTERVKARGATNY